MVRGEDHRANPCGALLAGRAGLVRVEVRGADRRPDPGLAGHRPGRAHAHPRPDRLRQDARCVPLCPRSPRPGPQPGTDSRRPRPRPCAVHLAAEGAHQRHGPQPACAADGDGARRARAATRPPRIARRHRTGDTPTGAPSRDRLPPAGHPHHDPRVAVHAADAARPLRPARSRASSSSTRSTPIAGNKRGVFLSP